MTNDPAEVSHPFIQVSCALFRWPYLSPWAARLFIYLKCSHVYWPNRGEHAKSAPTASRSHRTTRTECHPWKHSDLLWKIDDWESCCRNNMPSCRAPDVIILEKDERVLQLFSSIPENLPPFRQFPFVQFSLQIWDYMSFLEFRMIIVGRSITLSQQILHPCLSPKEKAPEKAICEGFGFRQKLDARSPETHRSCLQPTLPRSMGCNLLLGFKAIEFAFKIAGV